MRRRDFIKRGGSGLGAIALASMLERDGFGAVVNPLAAKQPHHKPTAKAVIWCFMEGGPSHLDLFDPKPDLITYAEPNVHFDGRGDNHNGGITGGICDSMLGRGTIA